MNSLFCSSGQVKQYYKLLFCQNWSEVLFVINFVSGSVGFVSIVSPHDIWLIQSL